MRNLCAEVLSALTGRTLATAESCTGGGIGAALTGVPGASQVYRGGVISYTNSVKARVLQVDPGLLERLGPVSGPVAEAMAAGVRCLLEADVAVAVTGLAGPGGDERGTPVGTVFLGYADEKTVLSRECHFSGDRQAVRDQAAEAALELVLAQNPAPGKEDAANGPR